MIIPRAREKWIEVALLLHAINKAAVRAASVRLGRPRRCPPGGHDLRWLPPGRSFSSRRWTPLSEVADVPTQEEPRDPRRRPNPVETLINKGMLPVEPRAADINVPKQPSWRRAACAGRS